MSYLKINLNSQDIKDSFKEAVESSGDEDSDDDEDLLKPRQKSQKENGMYFRSYVHNNLVFQEKCTSVQ